MGDRYEVIDLIGQGGMGVVLEARHRFTGERVALKMLHTHLSFRADLAQRFLAEARAPAAIGHPGIVRVLDAGTTERGEPYFAMELLEGEPLGALMRRGPMSFESLRSIGLQILDALGAAHAAGFIHRDLKPENVFLTRADGRVKLLDFGIAKTLGDLDTASNTATGATMGTLHYMSPEQLRNAKRVDHRTDLWAVGVILYQALTGQLPYFAESHGDMLLTVLSMAPRPLEASLVEVPDALRGFLTLALAVDPAQRFGSAAEMATALAGLPQMTLRYRSGVGTGDAAPTFPVPPTVTAAAPGATEPARTEPGTGKLSEGKKAFFVIAAGVVVMTLLPPIFGFFYWLPGYLVAKARTGQAEDGLKEGRACAVACKKLNDAGAVLDFGECNASCEGSPPVRECVKGADLSGVGGCFVLYYCGKLPSGGASCGEVADREMACEINDKDCICKALLDVKPAEAEKIVIHNSCSFTECKGECMGGTATREACQECYGKSCMRPVAICRQR